MAGGTFRRDLPRLKLVLSQPYPLDLAKFEETYDQN